MGAGERPLRLCASFNDPSLGAFVRQVCSDAGWLAICEPSSADVVIVLATSPFRLGRYLDFGAHDLNASSALVVGLLPQWS